MTPDELRARLAGLDGGAGGYDPDDTLHPDAPPGAPVPAAVLVPLMPGRNPGVLLTLRASHLNRHSGQVAFPGGRVDPEDASLEAAALREANEEIGLAPDHVELLGRLPDFYTGSNYRITPVVGLLPPDRDITALGLAASPGEVESLFTLPLSVLLDPAAPQRKTHFMRGQNRQYWEWPHDEHRIWGATAAILITLAERLRRTR